jgi:hypothetical protein
VQRQIGGADAFARGFQISQTGETYFLRERRARIEIVEGPDYGGAR